MVPATVQSPGFKWYSSLYVQGSLLWFGYFCVLMRKMGWYWRTAEALVIDRLSSDRHLFVALLALRFSHCQKTPKFYWSSNFSTAFKDHPYFIACSLLLLPLVCFSRELILWVHHNAQCKFPTMNARHSSKCWQQLSSLLPDMYSVPAGLSVLKSINPKWLVF